MTREALDDLQRAAREVGISTPPLLVRLFECAAADSTLLDACWLVGIEPEPVRVTDLDIDGEPLAARLAGRFFGFAKDGCGDVFGLRRDDPGHAITVCRVRHEDDSLEELGHSFDDWLVATLDNALADFLEPDDSVRSAVARIRSALQLA